MKVDLVEVEWLDHYSQDAWMTIEDLNDTDSVDYTVTTVGVLVKETKDWLYIASTVNKEYICQTMCILKRCVTKRKVLKKVEFTS